MITAAPGGIAARCFAHTGVYSVSCIGRGASFERTKIAGCPCDHDHLCHLDSSLLFASVREPAVYPQDLRIDPAAVGSCQEGNYSRDVLGLAQPLQW